MKNIASAIIVLTSFFIMSMSQSQEAIAYENNPYKQMYDEYKAARGLPADYNPWTKKSNSQSAKDNVSVKNESPQPAEEEMFSSSQVATVPDNELAFKEETNSTMIEVETAKHETANIRPTPIIETFKRHQFDVSAEISYIQYEEPDFMEENGPFYGLSFGYTYTGDDMATGVEGIINMVRAEGKIAFGQVEYESPISGTFGEDIDDFLGEARLLAGHHFPVNDWRVTPYLGVGYRYLNDDSSGMITSTGDAGYERESNYFYAPLGVTVSKQLNADWQISLNGEYDIFIQGKQKSHLSDVSPLVGDITNTQDEGFGARGFIEAKKFGDRYNFVISPYVRYWDIKDSDLAFIGVFNGIAYGGMEPANTSFESGLKIGFEF